MLEAGDVLRYSASGGHEERPRVLRVGMRAVGASRYRNSALGTRGNIDVVSLYAGQHNQLELGEFFNQLPGKGRALLNEHNHFGVTQTNGQLTDALDVVGVDLGFVICDLFGATELADGVLEVIEDHNVHR